MDAVVERSLVEPDAGDGARHVAGEFNSEIDSPGGTNGGIVRRSGSSKQGADVGLKMVSPGTDEVVTVTGSARGAAGDRGVVAVAVVGGDPVVGARGRGGVARRGGRAAARASRCR